MFIEFQRKYPDVATLIVAFLMLPFLYVILFGFAKISNLKELERIFLYWAFCATIPLLSDDAFSSASMMIKKRGDFRNPYFWFVVIYVLQSSCVVAAATLIFLGHEVGLEFIGLSIGFTFLSIYFAWFAPVLFAPVFPIDPVHVDLNKPYFSSKSGIWLYWLAPIIYFGITALILIKAANKTYDLRDNLWVLLLFQLAWSPVYNRRFDLPDQSRVIYHIKKSLGILLFMYFVFASLSIA